MERYQAPIKDMHFILKEIVNLNKFSKALNNNNIDTENIRFF